VKQRIFLRRSTQIESGEAPSGLRLLRTGDPRESAALGELLYESYRGTIDDEGEDLSDALEESRSCLAGKYGPVLAEASFVIEDDEQLLAAIVVTAFPALDAPLIAYVMCRPEAQRRGYARALVRQSLGALHAAGIPQVGLFVTQQNEPAMQLYLALGFQSGR
jgi:ribosomal protein S18 acetylase RimI-like enzyme